MIPAVASIGLLLAETVVWTAEADTQFRSRSEPAAHEASGEVEARGLFGLAAEGSEGRAALNWSPQVLLREGLYGSPLDTRNSTQQNGRLELRERLAPVTFLTSRTSLDWGLTDLSPLSAQRAPTLGVVLPSIPFVRTLGINSQLELSHAFSRRLQLSASLGVQRSGGVGHDAVQVVPFQAGPQASASLAWAADRNNSLSLLAAGSETRFFSFRRTSILSSLQAGWKTRATREISLDALAGVAWVRSADAESVSKGVYFSGAAGAVLELPVGAQRIVRGSLRTVILPAVDGFTGLGTETLRFDASTSFSAGSLDMTVSASRGRVVRGPYAGASDLRLEARCEWAASRAWSAEGGASATQTNQLPFVGWQSLLFVRFRWNATGSI